MRYSEQMSGELLILRIDEHRMDAAVTGDFRTYLHEKVRGGLKAMVLNLGQVQFVDSSGLGIIVTAHKLLNGKLSLCNLQHEVTELMKLTKMDQRLSILASEQEAIRSLGVHA
jgi:anti-sigma B factor antagonist